MFCLYGEEKKEMAFCGKCGAPLGEGKFCPKCGAIIGNEKNEEMNRNSDSKVSKPKSWKKIMIVIIALVIGGVVISKVTPTVDKPCDWCSNKPSVAYKTSDGSYAYVCRKCSKTCKLCGEKADRHYENLIGTMVFVCDDCYKGLQ